MLSFGGLLSAVLQGGSPGLTASNPGIVKVLGGFIFPVGLVMYVILFFPLGPLQPTGKLGSCYKGRSF
jgi:hypothetical protein